MKMTHALGISVIAATLVWAGPAGAQGTKPQFGLVAGVNFATLGGNDVSGVSSRTGLAVGATAAFHFKSGIFVQPMALFSVKGASLTSGTTTGDVKPSYIEVPILLGYQIPIQRSSLAPRIFVGPDLGVEVGCKFSATSGGQTAEVNCNDPLIGFSNTTFDYGVLGGAGIGFPLGAGSIEVNAFYSLGLSKIWSGVDAKNRSLSVSVAYMFPTGK